MKFLGPKVVDDVVRHNALGNHYDDNDGAVDGDGDDDGNDNNGNDDQVLVADDMMISTSQLGELHLQLSLLDQRRNHSSSRSPVLQLCSL